MTSSSNLVSWTFSIHTVNRVLLPLNVNWDHITSDGDGNHGILEEFHLQNNHVHVFDWIDNQIPSPSSVSVYVSISRQFTYTL